MTFGPPFVGLMRLEGYGMSTNKLISALNHYGEVLDYLDMVQHVHLNKTCTFSLGDG